MRRPWRLVGLIGGLLALGAGAVLLMGSHHLSYARASGKELERVEEAVRKCEAQLENARSAFREQLLRHGVGYVVEHPEDWADWRIAEKVAQIGSGWYSGNGELRGLVFVAANGESHAAWGDTAGAGYADRTLADTLVAADMAICSVPDAESACLVLCYRVQPNENSPLPARIVALLDARSVLGIPLEQAHSWRLYGDAMSPLLNAAGSVDPLPASSTTWGSLISRQSGSCKLSGGTAIVFSTIHVPGMAPLILVSNLPPSQAEMIALGLLLLGATSSVICFAGRGKSKPSKANSKAETESAEDPNSLSPYPIIQVTPEGLIQFYNAAALRSCSRIKSTPVVTDVLPSLERTELIKLLESRHGGTFESLFGSKPHSFAVVPLEEGAVLYAHPMSTSQTLEVALQQAQENFNTLCAVLPVPVLLVDPRSHVIGEANSAAAAFFQLELDQLRGGILDALFTRPVNLASSRLEFAANLKSGPVTCCGHCEMVKIEGAPMVLLVLQALEDLDLSEHHGPREQKLDKAYKTAETRDVRTGSAILVAVNPVVRDVARRMLEKTGHKTEVFTSLDDAITWTISHDLQPEMVAVDVSEFPAAADWLGQVRRRHAGVPCLAITDGVTFGLPCDGPNAYITKPFDLESLAGALSHLGMAVDLVEIEEHAG